MELVAVKDGSTTTKLLAKTSPFYAVSYTHLGHAERTRAVKPPGGREPGQKRGKSTDFSIKEEEKMRKRITSLLLTLAMLLSLLPAMGVTASAAEPVWETVNTFEELHTAVKNKQKYIQLCLLYTSCV